MGQKWQGSPGENLWLTMLVEAFGRVEADAMRAAPRDPVTLANLAAFEARLMQPIADRVR